MVEVNLVELKINFVQNLFLLGLLALVDVFDFVAENKILGEVELLHFQLIPGEVLKPLVVLQLADSVEPESVTGMPLQEPVYEIDQL